MVKRPRIETAADVERDGVLLAFGQRLRAARKAAGLTLLQVSKEAEMSQSYLFEIETVGANVSLNVLLKIASVLGVRLSDLLPPQPSIPRGDGAAAFTPIFEEVAEALDRNIEMLVARLEQDSHMLQYLRDLRRSAFGKSSADS